MSAVGGGSRELAYRLFALEFDDADFSYSESDEERAPNYVVTPTGARVNRLFVVGVLTEVEPVNQEMVRARVVDPSGAFVVYAGQYQPDAQAALERADPPSFIAVTGKARTFQPEDGDRIFTSIRPEAVSSVDAETRDRWTVQTAERTLDRVTTMAGAIESNLQGAELRAALRAQGVPAGLAAGIPLAIDHYGTTPNYLATLRELALDALRVVAGERDEVRPLEASPDAVGDVTAEDLATGDLAETISEEGIEAGSPAEPGGGRSGPAETPGDEPSDRGASLSGGSDQAEQPSAEAAPTRDSDATAMAPNDNDLGDFEADEFDLDDDQRREVEETYGTEFETGVEVDEPGEAGIEPESPADAPGASPEAPAADDAQGPVGDSPDQAVQGEASDEGSETAQETSETDVDLEEAVLVAMEDLDDGEGAARDAVVEAVIEATDADPGAVEGAIEDALMDGQCYEPGEGRLKAI